ncbi:MAG: hypothetical protein GYA21_09950 [Myxococcales bacterium]|nr:hypothetical protein [Myxococcales bacterium]
MPRTFLLICLACLLTTPSLAGTVRGTLAPLPEAKARPTPLRDSCFWRLGLPAAPAVLPPLLVLEGDAAPVPPAATAEIALSGFEFQPAFLVVTAGSTLTIRNHDPREYSCAASGAASFQIEKLPPGSNAEKKVTSEGTVELRCHGYPFIHAVVLVLPKAVWTTPDAEGKFQFANVPAGEYKARAYHNGAWHFESSVTVPAQGTIQLALGKAPPDRPEKAPGEGVPPPPVPEKPKPSPPPEPPATVKAPPPEKPQPPPPAPAPKPKPAEPKPKPEKPAPKEPEGGFKDVEPEVEVEVE